MSNRGELELAADHSFGPQFRSSFDFTLTFDHSVLQLIPATLLVGAVPILLYFRKRGQEIISPSYLLWLKLSVALAMFGVEITCLAMWSVSSTRRSEISISAASISCLSAFCLIGLLNYEHRYLLQSSAMLALWLVIAFLCDATRARSCFLREDLSTLGLLTTIVAALKVIILVLEEFPKDSNIRDDDLRRRVGRESTSGFWSRTLFLWLNKTFAMGYNKILGVNNLDKLGPEFSSESLALTFSNNWAPEINVAPDHSLAYALLQSVFRTFISIIFPRLCFSVFQFTQPIFLQTVVSYIQDPNQNYAKAGGLVGAAVFIYGGIMISRSWYTHMNYRLVVLIRGILVGQIQRKSFTLNFEFAQEATAATLISADMEGIITGVPQIHELWISILEVGFGIYLLVQKLGATSFLILIPTIASSVASAFLGDKLSDARVAWYEKSQRRVTISNKLLAQVRAVKVVGLDDIAVTILQTLRIDEIKTSKAARHWLVVIIAISSLCNTLPAPLLLAGGLFWTTLSGGLTAEDAFSILAIASILSEPIQNLVTCYPDVKTTVASLLRIETYFRSDERKDNREFGPPRSRSIVDSLAEKYRTEKIDFANSAIEFSTSPKPDNCVIEFRLATIAIQGTEIVKLTKISVSVDRCEVLMVFGRTGCGKSTFLKAVLGEIALMSGSIYVEPSNCAYCAQTPWLQNATVQSNIIGNSPLDEVWYNSVLETCLLKQDLAQLPDGDQTVLGSNGHNLSGGQKQRVALARALYVRSAFVILDDIFSALDSDTAESIVNRLLGEDGLLKKSLTTVILATKWIELLEKADKVLLIENNGTASVMENVDVSWTRNTNLQQMLTSDTLSDPVDEMEESDKIHDNPEDEDNDDNTEDDGAQENDARRIGDITLQWFYFRTFRALYYVIWLFSTFVAGFLDAFPDGYVRIWIETDPHNTSFFVGHISLSVAGALTCFLSLTYWYQVLVPSSSLKLHQIIVEQIMSSKLSFLTAADHGSLLNRLASDMTLLSQKLPLNYVKTVFIACVVLVRMGMVVAATRYTGIMVPILIAGICFLQKVYLHTSRQVRHLDLETRAPIFTVLSETAAGLQHIRAFGWQAQYLNHSRELLDNSQLPFYHMFSIQRWLALVLDFKALLIGVTIVALSVFFKNTTSGSAIGLSLVSLISLTIEINFVVCNWTSMEESLGSLARLRDFIRNTPVESDPAADDQTALRPTWPENGEIVMRNVTAKYSNDDNAPIVLDDVSVVVPSSNKVGIIGRTGSGKSSFLLAVLKFLDYTGTIEIDGIDISKVPTRELRKRITTISQDSLEFDESVQFNLCPWVLGLDPEAPIPNEEKMIDILEKLGLWRLIEEKGGLQTRLKSLGLSHGQKQLMCIARACMQRLTMGTNLVIIDEATSNLDDDTETAAQNVMNDTFRNCTVLIVAHRMETLLSTTMTLEMSNGKIIALSYREPTDRSGQPERSAAMKAFHTQPIYHPDLLRMVEQLERGQPPQLPPVQHDLRPFQQTVAKIKESVKSKGKDKVVTSGERAAKSMMQLQQNIKRNIERIEALEKSQQRLNQGAIEGLTIDLSRQDNETGDVAADIGSSDRFGGLERIPETDTDSDTHTDSPSMRSSHL